MKRRDFIRTGVAAGLVTWIYGGSHAFGQVRWEEELETLPIGDDASLTLGSRAVVGKGERNWYPRIAFDKDGTLHTLHITEVDEKDTLVAMTFDEVAGFSEPVVLSDVDGLAINPVLQNTDEGIVRAWISKKGTQYQFEYLSRFEMNAGPLGSEPRLPSQTSLVMGDASALFHPAVCDQFFAYERLTEGKPASIRLVGSGGENPQLLDSDGDRMRPAMVKDSRGRVWLAWDEEMAQGVRHVYIARIDGVENIEPIRVTEYPAMNIAPSLAADAHGNVWIGYCSNKRGRNEWDIPRWIYLRQFDGKHFYDPAAPMKSLNLDKEGTDQSFEFPRVICAPDGKVIVSGRPSHAWCFQYYQGGEWSPLYRVPADGWGGRGQYMEMALAPDNALWIVRRDLNANVLHKITGLVGDKFIKPKVVKVDPSARKIAAPVNIQRAPNRWPPLTDLEGIAEPLNIYYGDIHGHTWMSDGVGDVDQYFITKRDYYEDDFASLTDHDTFVGKSLTNADFEYQKALTQHYHREGKFVTLFGQEWTTGRPPKAAGHKCIYSTNIEIPLFDHDRPEFATTEKLYPHIKKWGGLVFPHHTGWVGTDWENWDPEIQTCAEIVSNHGRFEFPGNRPIPHRGNMPGCFIQDAFARGCRFGLIGGSDSHGLIWHHHAGWKRDCNRTGIACVLAPELTREAIFDALRKRRTFAATGIKPRIDFRVNNYLFGSEFDAGTNPISISFDVAAREDFKWITIVRNNETWCEFGGEGYTERRTIVDEKPLPGLSWYCLRMEFESGDMAWTSPIWVNRPA